MNDDREHLRLLKLFHYIVGGAGCALACFPLIHVLVGTMLMTESPMLREAGGPPPPAAFGLFFVVIGGLFFLAGQTLSICMIVSGRYISQLRNHGFSFVVACISCLFFPFGTVLGVFTLVVLSRDSVKALYDVQRAGRS